MNTKTNAFAAYALAGYKSFRGMEGNGFNVFLTRDGKKVADCIDDGNGGMLMVNWLDTKAPRVAVETYDYKGEPCVRQCTPEEAAFTRICDAQPMRKLDMGDGTHHMLRHDWEYQINEMVNRLEAEKRLLRMMKTKLVFLKGGRIYSTGYKGVKVLTPDLLARLTLNANAQGAEYIFNGQPLNEAVSRGLEHGL